MRPSAELCILTQALRTPTLLLTHHLRVFGQKVGIPLTPVPKNIFATFGTSACADGQTDGLTGGRVVTRHIMKTARKRRDNTAFSLKAAADADC